MIKYTKIQEDLNLNEKRQSTNANFKMTQMLEYSDEDFIAALIKMLHGAITKMLETNENAYMKSQWKLKDVKRKKMEILELKNT